MGKPRFESRRVDGARLRGKEQTIKILENLGLQCGLVPNRFAMFVAAIGVRSIAAQNPEIAEKALQATRRELCDPTLTLEDIICSETESLLKRSDDHEKAAIRTVLQFRNTMANLPQKSE